MAALTADADRKRHGTAHTRVGHANMAASTKVWKHSLVTLDADVLTSAKSTSPNVVGYAKKQYDNSSGAAGDIVGEFFWGDEIEIASSSVTANHVHRTMYAKDDNLVVSTSTTGPAVGIMTKLVSTDLVRVLVGTFEDKDGT